VRRLLSILLLLPPLFAAADDIKLSPAQALQAGILTAPPAQLDASEARYQLLLDAHLLWDLDSAAGHAGAGTAQ